MFKASVSVQVLKLLLLPILNLANNDTGNNSLCNTACVSGRTNVPITSHLNYNRHLMVLESIQVLHYLTVLCCKCYAAVVCNGECNYEQPLEETGDMVTISHHRVH